MEILAKYAVEIFFGLVSAGALAFCKHLIGKIKELEKLQKEDENLQYRKMILRETEPIIEELSRLKSEISQLEISGKQEFTNMKNTSENEHEQMYKDLEKTHAETLRALELIVNSYKFRLIQLCKSHLRDNYITEEDFEQITEMYKLYHGLGGNGQAQEYYEKVLKLPIHPNDEK